MAADRICSILEEFLRAAASQKNSEFAERCRQRKAYLTKPALERWGIVPAPSQHACHDIGLGDTKLEEVGLLRRSDDRARTWLFFRDSMLIPYREGGRVVFLSSRRLKDHDLEGNALPKDKKALCLPAPDSGGFGGVSIPDGFNLDAFDDQERAEAGLLVVEGPLDAIACCERGHPAVAIVGSSIRDGLAKRLRAWPGPVYVMLDGTADITRFKAWNEAAKAGAWARICALPDGQDPDDCNAATLAALKEQAVPAWQEAVELLAEGVQAAIAGDTERRRSLGLGLDGQWQKEIEDWLARECAHSVDVVELAIRQWAAHYPEGVAEFRKAIKQDAAELTPCEDAFGGQPPPMVPNWDQYEDDTKRPKLRNFFKQWVTLEKEEKRKNEETKKTETVPVKKRELKPFALPPWKIVKRFLEVTGGAMCRIRAPGAREPLLFYEIGKRPEEADAQAEEAEAKPYPRNDAGDGEAKTCKSYSGGVNEGRIAWIQKSAQFRAFAHMAGRLQFKTESDFEGTRYVQEIDTFHACAEVSLVREYEAIQVRPHQPPIPGHYYAWRHPRNYKAKGAYFAELLTFFSNCATPKDMAILAASFMSPGWGGIDDVRYGCRPMTVITAPDQGSGKTTIAQVVGDLWGGWLPMQLTPRAQDEFFQRALSPGGLLTRLVIIDNIRGILQSGFIDSLITEKYIRGKRMYQGDAMRPNDLTWIATLNNARLSRDMAERSFVVELKKPAKRASWSQDLAKFVAQNGSKIVADILAILARPKPYKSLGLDDRWATWCEEVLARACAWPGVAEVAGEVVDVREVLQLNQGFRDDCDVDTEQAEDVWGYILDRVVEHFIRTEGGQKVFDIEAVGEHVFVPSVESNPREPKPYGMANWIQTALNRKEVNAGWCKTFIMGHHNAGRLKDVRYVRKNDGRGYYVAGSVVVAELERRKKAHLEANPMEAIQQTF